MDAAAMRTSKAKVVTSRPKGAGGTLFNAVDRSALGPATVAAKATKKVKTAAKASGAAKAAQLAKKRGVGADPFRVADMRAPPALASGDRVMTVTVSANPSNPYEIHMLVRRSGAPTPTLVAWKIRADGHPYKVSLHSDVAASAPAYLFVTLAPKNKWLRNAMVPSQIAKMITDCINVTATAVGAGATIKSGNLPLPGNSVPARMNEHTVLTGAQKRALL